MKRVMSCGIYSQCAATSGIWGRPEERITNVCMGNFWPDPVFLEIASELCYSVV